MYTHVPLTIEGNYIDHLATVECSTGKPLVLSFIFMIKIVSEKVKLFDGRTTHPVTP